MKQIFKNKLITFFSNPTIHIIFLILFSSIILFWRLNEGSLVNWDEATHAQVAKGIVEENDWFALYPKGTTFYNFWFHKPPFNFWLMAIAYKLLGITTFASRAVSALFAIGCIVVTYFLGKELFNKKIGFIASLILILSPQFLHKSRMAMLDVPTTFFILLSFLIFLLLKKNQTNYYYTLLGISLALGTLTKQIVGLFPLFIILIYILLTKEFYLIKNKKIFQTIFIFFLIISPWYIAQLLINGLEFINQHIVNHVFIRAIEAKHSDYGNIFYFLVLLWGFYPWIIFLLPALILVIYMAIKYKQKQSILLLTWFIVIFGIFLIGKTKFPWYLIPLYPVLALFGAYFFTELNLDFKKYKIPVGIIFFLIFFIIYFHLPEPLYCNNELYNINLLSRDKDLFVHDSVKANGPGFVFYVGKNLTPTQDILKEFYSNKTLLFLMDKDYFSNNFRALINDSYKSLYQTCDHQDYYRVCNLILLTNDKNYFPDIKLSQIPKRPSLNYCYPYMPESLYKYPFVY